MIKSIKELCEKMEKKELKLLESRKNSNGAYGVFGSVFREINTQSDNAYSFYISEKNQFCAGFLWGLLASHFITHDEFELLEKERSAAYLSYLKRAGLAFDTHKSGEGATV